MTTPEFEHRDAGESWYPCKDADDLAHRLFMGGGQGRVTIETDGGSYVMEGPQE